MLSYLRRWNYWRKRNRNGFIHSLLVLFLLRESPTFNMTIDPKEWEDIYGSFQESLNSGLTKEQMVKLDKDLYDLAQNIKVKEEKKMTGFYLLLFAIIICGCCAVVGIVFHRLGYDKGVSSGYKIGHGLREEQLLIKEKESEEHKIECDVCGKKFHVESKSMYVSRDTEVSGAFAALNKIEAKRYDTIDCPECGRQIILGERKYRTTKYTHLEEQLKKVTTNLLEEENENED